MSKKKDLAKNAAILMFGNICTRFMSFLLLPLYTALLKTTEYGTYDLLISYASLFIPLVNWQLDQAVFRFVVDARENEIKRNEIFSSVLTMNVLQLCLFASFILFLAYFREIKNAWFLICYVFFNVMTNFYLQFLRGLGKNFLYATVNFISALLTIIANIVCLVVLKMGLFGMFVASSVSLFLVLMILTIILKPKKYYRLKYIKKEVIIETCRYSVPLIPNNIAWWIIGVSDRTIVSYFLGVAYNGIYTVANKFSTVFISFYNIINMAWTECVSLHFSDDDREEFLSEAITDFYRIFSCACLFISAAMPFLFSIMIDNQYSEAYYQILILLFAMLLQVVVGLYSTVYVATKDTCKIASTSAKAALINIVTDLLLIKRIGLYAASLSTLIAFGSMAMIRYHDINKIVKIKISSNTIISSIILAILVTITYYIKNLKICGFVLALVTFYSVIINRDMIISGFKIIKNRILSLK